MIPTVVYPIPFDKFDVFERFVRRFADTFKKYSPGVEDYEVVVVCNWGEPTDEIREWFWGIKARFVPYYKHGCDIGSLQYAGAFGDFLIGMTSRCYFHRKGWLKRYVDARQKHGPGLYGASASHEGGTPHICTRAYGIDTEILRKYPYQVQSRGDGQKFETGEWCLTSWALKQGLPTMQITWDAEQDMAHWRDPKEQGIYRRGDQNAMLVWDRHTDIFKDADQVEKQRLAKLADPL